MIFNKPEVGSWVQVETDYSAYKKNFRLGIQRKFTTTGRVVESQEWENTNSFSLLTTDPKMPIKTIDLSFVSGITMLDGSTVRASDARFEHTETQAEATEAIAFQIKGSKGNFYEVKKLKFNWSCNCEAGSRGRHCKHIKEAQATEKA